MSDLKYEKLLYGDYVNKSEIFHVQSPYDIEQLKDAFVSLRVNVVDMNPSLVTKCIQGTEQDFIMLMNKAKEYLQRSKLVNDQGNRLLMKMFQDCVFGYYILTPLIENKEVSDIKIYRWNHITCKANGDRFVTDLSFSDEEDYNRWFDRLLRIHRLARSDDFALQKHTDRKGALDYYMRIDIQLNCVVSTEFNNVHIRKIPKEKYSWQYLFDNHMLDNDMLTYLKDRIVNGYGFLISGKGGSGKTSLLNNMIDMIPFSESILVSQESDELYSEIHPQIQFEHTFTVKRNDVVVEYTLEDELRMGLLQDIDNFIIGEIKGGEALYVFTTAMSTGARFFGTIHSNDARGSVRRLAHCARYISDYSVNTLEEMLTSTPFCLIHMSRFSIDEILEIDGWDEVNNHLLFKEVYKKEFNRMRGAA